VSEQSTAAAVQVAWEQVLPGLRPEEFELATPPALKVYVDKRPTRQQMRMVRAKPDELLLGMYTRPREHPIRGEIVIFDETNAEAGSPPEDTLWHELSHALGYDHELAEVAIGLTVSRDGARCSGPGCAPAAHAHVHHHAHDTGGWSDACPTCLLHSRLTEPEALMSELRMYAHVQHGVPQGLGGTIELSRRRIAEARAQIPMVARMVPGRVEQLHRIAAQLDAADAALTGYLTPEDISDAARLIRQARREAYLVAWQKFANGRGQAPWSPLAA